MIQFNYVALLIFYVLIFCLNSPESKLLMNLFDQQIKIKSEVAYCMKVLDGKSRQSIVNQFHSSTTIYYAATVGQSILLFWAL